MRTSCRVRLLPTGAGPVKGPACKEKKAAPPIPEPAQELPQYTSEDLVQRSREDARWIGLLAEAQRVLGRKLNSNNLPAGIYIHNGKKIIVK